MPDAVRNVLYPAITFVALIALWVGYLDVFNVPDYILPTPAAVWKTTVAAYTDGFIYPHLLFTLKSTVIGYVFGCLAGLLLGGLLGESRSVERFIYPYVIVLQSMPKVALAPLIIVWFGFGIESKIAMVTLISFFPVFVNTFVGVRQADPELIDTLRACSAGRWRIFFDVKLPCAAGAIFAGLQIAVVLGLIGAVVAEFVASKQGIGTMLQSAAVDLNTSLMLTGVLTLAAIGVGGNMLIRFLHRKIVFWHGPQGGISAESP